MVSLVRRNLEDFNLTGTWQADEGGTYYLRNIANRLWWLGISSNDDGRWAYLFLRIKKPCP
ncbi:MAG: hypothetical protein ACRD5E_04820 [Nitrososphaeraceae archaeon]